jgi:predicted CXXCH cytochrome family protein
VAADNSGSSTLTADGCAGCHRAHTAQGPKLLAAESAEALCLQCHGANVSGATTNVIDGVQYAVGANPPPVRDGTTIIGALRGGGFVNARIDSANPYRYFYGTKATSHDFITHVSALPKGAMVTSAHLKIADATTGVTLQGTAWGNSNGTFSSSPNPGPAVSLTCASCHNPHGNDMYRILNPVPSAAGLIPVAPVPTVSVSDGTSAASLALVSPGDARNYTIIQVNSSGTRIYLASDVKAIGNATAGDYFHRKVPWNKTSGTTGDAPNADTTNFSSQMGIWCSACHTRYNSALQPGDTEIPSGDAIFKYRHSTTGSKPCTTCHVAHGSNAVMSGPQSAAVPYPGGSTPSTSSRLLKVDNRGTCQMCHDPTFTVVTGASHGTRPSPDLP